MKRDDSQQSSSWQSQQEDFSMDGCSCLFLPRSIRSKLFLSLLIISGLGIIATVSTIYSMWRIEDKIQIIESFFELNQKVLEMRRYEKNYLLYNNKEDLMSALDYIDQVRASIISVKQSFPIGEEELQLFSDNELGKYELFSQQLMADEFSRISKKALENTLRTLGQDITKQIFDMDARARVRVEREVAIYQKIGVVILFWAILLGGILIFFLVRWIMRPLMAIREAAAQIIQGKMAFIPVNAAVSCSEEGVELVNSLNLMLRTINAKQDQLVQSEKLAAIGKVTAGIAHEINNPLNNISLTAEVLLEDLEGKENSEHMEMVHDILTQSDRARKVVHHLLEFSRNRKSQVTAHVDLVQLVDDSLALVKNQFRMSGVHYDFQHKDKPVEIIGNPHQLQQVLVNIMLNAVQAMSSGGLLRLQVEAENGQALVTISDNGGGIRQEMLPHIFDPFFTTKNDGTGLGLSLSYAIIKEHQGNIEVDNKEGLGTTFRIILPQNPANEE